jgi:hypothetical protein
MLKLLPVFLLVAALQEPKKPVAPADNEVIAPGLPEGDAPRLPEQVNWDLKKAVTARTATRERMDLGGLWRFAPVADRETAPQRSEMGWIEMPGVWTSPDTPIYDSRLRVADGQWQARPLDEFPLAWVERDLPIGNDVVTHWLDHRSYLVLRGPWARAVVYSSLRVKGKPKRDSEEVREDGVTVYVEPLVGVVRDGATWFELTETMMYPHTNQVNLRLGTTAAAQPRGENAKPENPYVGVELLPTGPRVDAIRLTKDAARGELDVAVDLVRPKGFMLIPGPPVSTIPLTVRLRLDDASTGETIQKLDQAIGPMPDNERTVSIRLPWSTARDAAPPKQARLRVRLYTTAGRLFDEAYPVEFRPDELPAATQKEEKER